MNKPQDYGFNFDVQLSILFIAYMTIILILLFVGSVYELSKPVSINTIKESAWIACKTYAEKQLQIAHNNIQEYTSNSVTKLMEQNHYEVEVHYTDGHMYRCDLARLMDGNWFLKSLYVQ